MWSIEIVFICPMDVLWYTSFHNFFPLIGLKLFFVGISDLLDYGITNAKNICEAVSP